VIDGPGDKVCRFTVQGERTWKKVGTQRGRTLKTMRDSGWAREGRGGKTVGGLTGGLSVPGGQSESSPAEAAD
jgi:hypothetical protein